MFELSQTEQHLRGRRRELKRWRRLLVEQLEGRALLAAIITVNSTADADARDEFLTLREAIEVSNRTLDVASLTAEEQAQISGTPTASDTDTISFNIPNEGVHTISPLSALPTITEPVIIDGYTQAGASPNTLSDGDNAKLLIEINGFKAGPTNGLSIATNDSTVRGLVINLFRGAAIGIFSTAPQTASNNVIEGNFLGTTPSGIYALGNGYGVHLAASESGGQGGLADQNRIGGSTPAARNLISGQIGRGGSDGGYGIGLDTTPLSSITNTVIQGNFIGTDVTGTKALANSLFGILAQNGVFPSLVIGGSAAGEGNLISGNDLAGIFLSDETGQSNARIQGNKIGTDITGTLPIGIDSGYGIFMDCIGQIGGLNPGEGNIIAFHQIAASAFFRTTAILGNSIFQNLILGIDLGGNGATANDPGDADYGENYLQNFPTISYATRDVGKLKLKYNVPSDPASSTYPLRVEFFLADANGQGKTYLGFDTFSETDFTAGGKTATFVTAAPIKVFDKIVATATDSLTAVEGGGPANTSEFSSAVTIVSPWQNPGRLRWDVNDDTFVSAEDVLDVINRINAKGAGQIPGNAANQKPYYDVDNDLNVAAADVIEIINYINSGRKLGGEAPTEQESATSDQQSATSDVMALLSADVAAQASRKRRI